MIKKLAALMFVSIGAVSALVAPPVMANCTGGNILTLKPWYSGLTCDGNNSVVVPSDPDGQKNMVWTIGLNIVEDLLQIVGYLTIGMLIYGGFVYMISTGKPDKITAGKKIIINSLVAMVIAISSVLLVNLVIRNALGVN